MGTGPDHPTRRGPGASAPAWIALVAAGIALAVSLADRRAGTTAFGQSLGAPVETSVLPDVG